MNADTAPAAMPGEEDVARVLMKQFYEDWFAPGKLAHGGSVYWDFVNGSSAWTAQARAILALFARILAEKEALERANAELVAVVNDRRFVRCGEECCSDDPDPNCALEGEFRRSIEALEARALAAEAALAAMVKVLEPFDDALGEDDEGYGDGLTVVMKWGACTDYSVTLGDLRDVRKAIRAQGE